MQSVIKRENIYYSKKDILNGIHNLLRILIMLRSGWRERLPLFSRPPVLFAKISQYLISLLIGRFPAFEKASTSFG